MSSPALRARMVLDGQPIEHPTASWDVAFKDQKIVHELATGDRREQVAEPPAGHPTLKRKRVFTHGWTNLGAAKDQVELLLAGPGIHELILWRPEYLQWLGDGERSEFVLPNGWILATDAALPPGGVTPSTFDPRIHIGIDGTDLTYVSQDQATYDAGAPNAGEVWFLASSDRFKLSAAPAQGALIYGRVVPRYLVYQDGSQSVRLDGPVKEPRELRLLEK